MGSLKDSMRGLRLEPVTRFGIPSNKNNAVSMELGLLIIATPRSERLHRSMLHHRTWLPLQWYPWTNVQLIMLVYIRKLIHTFAGGVFWSCRGLAVEPSWAGFGLRLRHPAEVAGLKQKRWKSSPEKMNHVDLGYLWEWNTYSIRLPTDIHIL